MCQPAGALTTIWPNGNVGITTWSGSNAIRGGSASNATISLVAFSETRLSRRILGEKVVRTSEGVGKKYAHTMISTATKPQSIFPPRSFIAPILTRNDSHQRLDLCRRCLRGIEFLSRTQRLVSGSSSTGARVKREPLTSTATSPGTFKADWTRACRSTCIVTDLQPGYARAERHLRHPDVGPVQGRNPLGLRFLRSFDLPELLRATAWRTSALKADSSTSAPSWMSIARRAFPSRLELKRRAGSFRDAPLEKVSSTTFL